MRIHLLAALVVSLAPTAAAAQAVPAEWSRVMTARSCHPDHPCTPRRGLVWIERNPIPRYPGVMAQVGIGGPVVVRFVVRPDGFVDSESIRLEQVVNRAFEQATIDAVRSWRFDTEAEGRPGGPIPVTMRIAYAITTGCGYQRATSGQAAWSTHDGERVLVVTSGCPYRVPPSELRTIKEG